MYPASGQKSPNIGVHLPDCLWGPSVLRALVNPVGEDRMELRGVEASPALTPFLSLPSAAHYGPDALCPPASCTAVTAEHLLHLPARITFGTWASYWTLLAL
ncbi:unnamed protein product [Arctogadus glacialis]